MYSLQRNWMAQKCTCPYLTKGKGSRYDLGSAHEIDSCETGREKGKDTSSSSGAMWATQLCPTLFDPMDCSPSDSSGHGILQARILEWVAIPFSGESSWPRDRTQGSNPGLLIADRFFAVWATRALWADRDSGTCHNCRFWSHQEHQWAEGAVKAAAVSAMWTAAAGPHRWEPKAQEAAPLGLTPPVLPWLGEHPSLCTSIPQITGILVSCPYRMVHIIWKWSRSVTCNSLQPHGL